MVILGILVTAIGYLRIVATGSGKTVQTLLQGDPETAMGIISDSALTRTRGVENIVVMNDYMEHSKYHYFLGNIYETAHSIIPAVILPKDISLTEKISTAVYADYMASAGNIRDIYGGVSYTVVAEGCWNLGMAGVILTCTLMGYTLQVIEFRAPSVPVSYMQVIIYKTFAGAMVAFVEAPQLGVNGIALNLLLNVGLLVFMSTAFQFS